MRWRASQTTLVTKILTTKGILSTKKRNTEKGAYLKVAERKRKETFMEEETPTTNRSVEQREEFQMNRTLEERQAYLEGIVNQLNHRVTKMEEGEKNKMNNGSQKLKWIRWILWLGRWIFPFIFGLL